MRSRRLALLFALADGPHGLIVMACTSTHICKIVYIYITSNSHFEWLTQSWRHMLLWWSGSWACWRYLSVPAGFSHRVCGSWPYFLDGFEAASNRRDNFRKFCWFLKVWRSWRYFWTPVDLPEEEELAGGGEDLWHMEQPLPLNPIIRATVVARWVTQVDRGRFLNFIFMWRTIQTCVFN